MPSPICSRCRFGRRAPTARSITLTRTGTPLPGLRSRPPFVVAVAREERDDQPRAVITVRDEGVGIPAADLPHVLEQHGGTVTVESREDHGSTFTVLLPLDTPPSAA
ncbi:MAG TPA: ATP-binding protein [Thermomicrobiales bacterium]|jgi:signal transduction histidine kinase